MHRDRSWCTHRVRRIEPTYTLYFSKGMAHPSCAVHWACAWPTEPSTQKTHQASMKIKPITPWGSFIAWNITFYAYRSRDFDLRVRGENFVFEGLHGALEEVAVHTGHEVHRKKFSSVKLHCRGASRRCGALGLGAAHRTYRPVSCHFGHPTHNFFYSK